MDVDLPSDDCANYAFARCLAKRTLEQFRFILILVHLANKTHVNPRARSNRYPPMNISINLFPGLPVLQQESPLRNTPAAILAFVLALNRPLKRDP